jgi:hypothetical protein
MATPIADPMTTRPFFRAAVLAVALLAVPAAAQEQRPSEEDLFGTPPSGPPAAQNAPEPPPPPQSVSREKEDALKVGGLVYVRGATSVQQDQRPEDWRFTSPNLVDVYLDVRPNDRVRGFVLGRLFYDPTLPPAGVTTGLPTRLSPVTFLNRTVSNPTGVLDQLWVNFDVERRAFVTAGRQHVKWGVGHFWNPTDYLHPVHRDPLAVFDVRTGTTMVKVHVPWEARGWNLYGMTVFDDIAGQPPVKPDGTPDATNRLGRIGVGGRAEVVLGRMEIGADALAQQGHRPRFGVDVSAGIWDFDVYAEAALRTQVDQPRWCATSATPLFDGYGRCDPDGFIPQVVAGANYSVKYSDEDAVTFGAEYFYDKSGYTGASIYPVLLGVAALAPIPSFGAIPNPVAGQPNPFTTFYLGRHYGSVYASLPNPGSWNNTTFTLSVLGNLADKSFIARLDHSVLVNTYLRIETFVAGHFGSREGEFRLGFDVPPQQVVPGLPPFSFSSQPLVLDAGIALRVTL